MFYKVAKLVSGQHNNMIKALLLFCYLSSIISYRYIHLSFCKQTASLAYCAPEVTICFHLRKQYVRRAVSQNKILHYFIPNMTGNTLTSAEVPEWGEFKAMS